jgi:hypothetical protein
MHARGVAAAISLSILVACGCVDATTAPSADGSAVASAASRSTVVGTVSSSDPGGALPTPSASIAPAVPPGSQSTLSLTIDPSLEATLPEQIGTMRFVRHSLAPGDALPPVFSDSLGRARLRAGGSADGRLSVAWSAPTTVTSNSRYAVTILAIRIPGAVARNLRDAVALERLLAADSSDSIVVGRYERTSMLFVGDQVVMTSGNTLYLLSFPTNDAQAVTSPVPGPEPTPPFTEDELFAALPAADPELAEPEPTRRPLPSIGPDVSPPPDPTAEALLPDRIRGGSVTKISGRGPALYTGEWVYLGIPAYVMATQLGLDLSDRSAAGGHPDGISTYWIVATPVPGFDARAILAAWFRQLLPYGLEATAVQADGRVAILYNNQAVYAEDGLLYWMTYLDLGDFPPASPAPRPALRDLVIDTLRALP